MTVDVAREIIKYLSMFLFIGIAILSVSLLKINGKRFTWFKSYYGLIIGFIIGAFWSPIFNFITSLFGWS